MGVAKKLAATAASTAWGLAWKRLSWQASPRARWRAGEGRASTRAALQGGRCRRGGGGGGGGGVGRGATAAPQRRPALTLPSASVPSLSQARAALMGGSFALGAARKLNNIRKALGGGGGSSSNGGRRRLHTAAAPVPLGMSPAAAAFAVQRQAANPVWAPAVRQACSGLA